MPLSSLVCLHPHVLLPFRLYVIPGHLAAGSDHKPSRIKCPWKCSGSYKSPSQVWLCLSAPGWGTHLCLHLSQRMQCSFWLGLWHMPVLDNGILEGRFVLYINRDWAMEVIAQKWALFSRDTIDSSSRNDNSKYGILLHLWIVSD